MSSELGQWHKMCIHFIFNNRYTKFKMVEPILLIGFGSIGDLFLSESDDLKTKSFWIILNYEQQIFHNHQPEKHLDEEFKANLVI